MKKFLKVLVLALSLVFVFSSAFACGATNSGDKDPDGKVILQIGAANKGYGLDWINALGAAFSQKTGIGVKVTPLTGAGEDEISKLQTNSCKYDILFVCSELSYQATAGKLVNLYDGFYNAIPYGADAGATKIKDLCKLTNMFKFDLVADSAKSYYAVPYAISTETLLYNKTTLDSIYGSGNYTLPRTTDEFFAMCEDIYTNHGSDAYALTSIGNYTEALVDTWWAQYDGYDSYFDYWKGYKDGSFCSSDPIFAKTQGRLEALTVLQNLVVKNGSNYKYFHSKISDFISGATGEAANSTKAFIGKVIKQDTHKVAFMPNGDWFENEIGDLNNQEIFMMKVPVISSITDTFVDATDKTMSDATLSSIIDKIDKGTAYSKAVYNCEQSTYNKIKEAREMVYSLGAYQQAGIPSTSKCQTEALDLLRFMASNDGQKIYSKNEGGLSMGYGYTPDSSVTVTNFINSVNDINSTSKFIYRDISNSLCYRGGLAAFTDIAGTNNYTSLIFNGESAQTIYNETYSYLVSTWTKIKQDSGIN